MNRARKLLLLFLLVAGSVLLFGEPTAEGKNERDLNERDLTVMTRNVYVGSDFSGVFGTGNPVQLMQGAKVAFDEIVASNFEERAAAMAREVEQTAPDLIGLQEVVLLRTGPPDSITGNPTPATTVFYDYLQILLDAFEERGLHYAPVVIHTGLDAELPVGFPPTLDARLTDRDVILRRTDLKTSELKVLSSASGIYSSQASIGTGAGPLTFKRGWSSVDVKVRGKVVRVVNTHLEISAFAAIQVAQGNQLLSGPGNTSLPVILLGDFNSDASGATTNTYANIIAAGYADAASSVGDPELTCCQNANLLNPTSVLYEQVDLIFFKGKLEADEVQTIGDTPAERTPSGLWPSDHAGVVADVHFTK